MVKGGHQDYALACEVKYGYASADGEFLARKVGVDWWRCLSRHFNVRKWKQANGSCQSDGSCLEYELGEQVKSSCKIQARFNDVDDEAGGPVHAEYT